MRVLKVTVLQYWALDVRNTLSSTAVLKPCASTYHLYYEPFSDRLPSFHGCGRATWVLRGHEYCRRIIYILTLWVDDLKVGADSGSELKCFVC